MERENVGAVTLPLSLLGVKASVLSAWNGSERSEQTWNVEQAPATRSVGLPPRAASVMRLFLSCILAFSMLAQSEPGFAADDGWTGFWRLEQKPEQKVHKDAFFYLWISSSGRLRLFDSAWKNLQLASESGLEGESLKLSQYFKGGQIIWSGQREGESLKGEWEFLHVQYRVQGSFSATRASGVSLKDWNPLRAARATTTADGILNLTSILDEKAVDEEGFEDHWENTFVPQFLPFVPELPESSEAWSVIQDDQEVAAGVKFAEHFSNLTRLLRKISLPMNTPAMSLLLPLARKAGGRL